MSSCPSIAKPHYRADIDGLRAVAVIAVVVFHAFPSLLRGGFIGVDVFFVISGFLISTIIFENLAAESFSLREFYGRRIRRVFPALIAVLIACATFGWFALFSEEYKQLGKHVVAGSTFVSNFMLLSEVGYFDEEVGAKPLLHLWSLAIEEQFYLVWPVLVIVLWKWPRTLLAVTCAVSATSFYLSVRNLRIDPASTYYLPHTRMWELLCGGLLAWFYVQKQALLARANEPSSEHARWIRPITARLKFLNSFHWANVLSVLGALILAFGFWRVNGGLAFPGKWAAVPVLGTVLLLAAGPAALVNRTILAHRVAVWVGLISYPLYLWHWPILSFARIIFSETPSVEVRVVAIGASIILAWLTYTLIERRARSGAVGVTSLIGLLIAVALIGHAVHRAEGFPLRSALSGYVDNQNELNRTPAKDTACIAYVGTDTPLFPYCRFTNIGARETVAVIGDSHAHAAYPGIAELLKSRGINTALFANSGCPPILGVPIGATDLERRSCADRIAQILDTVTKREDIRIVIFITRGPVYWTGSEPATEKERVPGLPLISSAEFIAGSQRALDLLARNEKHVIYVTENPELASSPRACLTRPLRPQAKDCNAAVGQIMARQQWYLKAVGNLSNATVLVSLDAFCPNGHCRAFDSNGALLYADDDHLSVAGSRFQAVQLLAPYLPTH